MRLSAIVVAAGLALASTTGLANQGVGSSEEKMSTRVVDEGAFQLWDKNNNERITEQEFGQAVRGSGWFNGWDMDNNNALTKKEFDRAGFKGPFSRWDADNNGTLSQNEFYGGFHDWYDQDEDGNWAIGEWDEVRGAGWFDA